MRKLNNFFVNIGLKLASKIPVSNTHWERYVKNEGPILERKELFDEELKNVLSSLQSNISPGYDDISSNVIKSVSEDIFGVLKNVLNLSVSPGVFPENMKFACYSSIQLGSIETFCPLGLGVLKDYGLKKSEKKY